MCSKKSLKSWASIWRVKTKRQDWSSVHGVSKTMAQRAMLWLSARSWGASKCAFRHLGPTMEVGVVVSFTGIFFVFFARKVDFGAKLSREETQERATNVGPVKKKEKKRERKREREREGRKDQKIEVSAPM